MRGRPELPSGRGFEIDPFEESVERQIEVQSGLFSIGDHVESRLDLVLDGNCDGVFNQLFHVGSAEPFEVLGGKLEPSRKGITPDHSRSQRLFFHFRRKKFSRNFLPSIGVQPQSRRGLILCGSATLWLRARALPAGLGASSKMYTLFPDGP